MLSGVHWPPKGTSDGTGTSEGKQVTPGPSILILLRPVKVTVHTDWGQPPSFSKHLTARGLALDRHCQGQSDHTNLVGGEVYGQTGTMASEIDREGAAGPLPP